MWDETFYFQVLDHYALDVCIESFHSPRRISGTDFGISKAQDFFHSNRYFSHLLQLLSASKPIKILQGQ